MSKFLQDATTWFAWLGIGLTLITLIAFITKWGIRFRLVGASVFALLLSGSCWAFQESYTPPIKIEGALYVPVVYDNGADLVVAQASEEFPHEAIQPSLEQIAENLKGGGRNVKSVHVRIRKIETVKEGVSKPIVLGEVIRDPSKRLTVNVANNKILEMNSFRKNDNSGEPTKEDINDLETYENIYDQENYGNVEMNSNSEEDLEII